MSPSLDRELLAQVIILLAVCIGGWMMLVEPKVSELHALEATIAEARTNPILTDQHAIERMARELKRIRERVGGIVTQNRFARDSSRMYSLIMALAEEHEVTVEHLDPGTTMRSERGPGKLHTVTFEMQVAGGYEQVSAFLAAVVGIEGFVRPVTLAVAPAGEGDRVEASFTCEAVSFAVPRSLQLMVEDDGADG